jgi:sodium-dependent dicarboxylate transporter 2/3/5
VLGVLACAYALLALGYRVRGAFQPLAGARLEVSGAALRVMLLFGAAVAAWLSEPIHGVPAALVGLGVTSLLFLSGLLAKADLGALDWPTLGLIAGGISLGKLLEQTGLVAVFAQVDWGALPGTVWLAALVFTSALLSAVMSNTATAALLIPLGLSIDGSASTAVLIAIGASFGMPFAISTPPNAMAYGEGLATRDLLWVGLAIMVIGCLLVTFTGRAVLGAMGVP